MTKFQSSDGLLFISLISSGKNSSLKEIISTGDMLNHAIFNLDEINNGLSRLNAIGFIKIENKDITITDEGKSFFSQNKISNEGCITMQSRFSNIFVEKEILCEVKYNKYFSTEEYSEACKKSYKETMAIINSLLKK